MRSLGEKTKERDRHIAALIGNGFLLSEIHSLLRKAKSLSGIAERQCSEEMSPEETARVEKREAFLERSIAKIVSTRNARVGKTADEVEKLIGGEEGLGRVSVTFDGDPRGYVVKLHLPDGAYNTLGGRETGWGIG